MTIIEEMYSEPEKPITDPIAFRREIESDFREHFDSATSAKLFMELFWSSRMEAFSQNVVVDWENPEFVRIFITKYRHVYLNCNTHTIQPLIYGDVTPKEFVESWL